MWKWKIAISGAAMPRHPSSAMKRRGVVLSVMCLPPTAFHIIARPRIKKKPDAAFAGARLDLFKEERSLDRFLQFLGGAEGDLLARLDLDGFARRRIAAHAGGALAHDENAQTVETDAGALLQMLGDRRDRVVEERVRRLVG